MEIVSHAVEDEVLRHSRSLQRRHKLAGLVEKISLGQKVFALRLLRNFYVDLHLRNVDLSAMIRRNGWILNHDAVAAGLWLLMDVDVIDTKCRRFDARGKDAEAGHRCENVFDK